MDVFPKLPSGQTFFSAADLARLLQVSPQRVSQLITEGKIQPPAVRIGRAVGYTPEQAAQILQARQSSSTSSGR